MALTRFNDGNTDFNRTETASRGYWDPLSGDTFHNERPSFADTHFRRARHHHIWGTQRKVFIYPVGHIPQGSATVQIGAWAHTSLEEQTPPRTGQFSSDRRGHFSPTKRGPWGATHWGSRAHQVRRAHIRSARQLRSPIHLSALCGARGPKRAKLAGL